MLFDLEVVFLFYPKEYSLLFFNRFAIIIKKLNSNDYDLKEKSMFKNRKAIFFAILLTSLFILVGCSGEKSKNSAKNKDSIQVVTTFYPMYDFTKNVAGKNADVTMLITGNTEPHDYEPSPKDIAKIQDADLFVYNSDEMETWVKSVLKDLDRSKTVVVEASKGISLLDSEEETHSHDEEHHHDHDSDPHVWLDPVLAQEEAENIYQGLIKADRQHKANYKQNYQTYQKKLNQLDQAYKKALASAQNRTFVTQHTAFSYLAKRYDLTQKAIAGFSPDQEPSAAGLAKIENFVKENNIRIIFTEELASPKIAKTIANATGAKLEPLSPLESLSEKDQKAGADYISVMQQNLKQLRKVID